MQTRLVGFIVCHVCSGSLVLGKKRVVGLQVDVSAARMAISIRFKKSARFRFLNDVTVGLVFGKAALSFFSMASLESCLVHGWERRRKARIVRERRESYGKGVNRTGKA